MQEQKEFSTVLFGFDKKAVLEYIYEQDKEARAALTELAERNTALEDSAEKLKASLDTISEQYEGLDDKSRENQKAAEQAQNECTALRDRLQKLSAQYHEKENSLQLQMEINKKMQTRITEQEETIKTLRQELEKSQKRWKLFNGRKTDYTALQEKLEALRGEFREKLSAFEKEIAEMEREAAAAAEVFPKEPEKVKPDEPEKPQEPEKCAVHRVSPRLCTGRPAPAAENAAPGAVSRNQLKSILNDWK